MPAPLNENKFWKEMTEDRLFLLMKNYHSDIVNFNELNKFAEIDWYIPSIDAHIEVKCRNEDYDDYYIEKPKWDALMKKENGWYMNSTPTDKLIYWNIPKLNWEPMWEERMLPETTEYGERKLVLKTVTRLYKYQSQQFHYHLLY